MKDMWFVFGRLEKDLYPFFAKRPITKITAPELLEVLRKIESIDAVLTAHRCLQYTSRIFRSATGRTSHDIAVDLRGALSPVIHLHFSSLKRPQKASKALKGSLILIPEIPS
jgi:hypothetical protein